MKADDLKNSIFFWRHDNGTCIRCIQNGTEKIFINFFLLSIKIKILFSFAFSNFVKI